jgi:antitoxin (DNA-binding transcriptional repressor) of toxin-antitoxin stability system
LTEILERVLEGEQMVVTRYGSPVAAIVPVPADLDGRDRPLGLAAFAGAIASRPSLYERVADVVAVRTLAPERHPPEIA